MLKHTQNPIGADSISACNLKTLISEANEILAKFAEKSFLAEMQAGDLHDLSEEFFTWKIIPDQLEFYYFLFLGEEETPIEIFYNGSCTDAPDRFYNLADNYRLAILDELDKNYLESYDLYNDPNYEQ